MTKIGVVGAGVMGRGIVQWATAAADRVLAYDLQPGTAEQAKEFISGLLSRSVQRGRMTAAQRDDALARIDVVEALDDLAACDVVIEAIVEEAEAKRDLFARLEAILDRTALLCTNTSSLSVTEIAAGVQTKDRVAGLHFFNPVPVMKVTEIVAGELTTNATMTRLEELIRRTDHYPIICADSPGFVINHAGRGLYTEGLRIEQEKVASPADIDRIVRDGIGLKMGPFELFDLTGLDVSGEVLHLIYNGYQQEPRYRPTPTVRRRMTAGLFGRKVGGGFYEYGSNGRIDPPEAQVPEKTPHGFSTRAIGDSLDSVERLLSDAGLTKVDAETADFVLLNPLGEDTTTSALRAGIDPTKSVAVDTLFPDALRAGGRATLMGCPATHKDVINAAHAAFSAAGLKVTVIDDSPGFVGQRITAMIVNTACEIAQQRIASPADIDAGATLGLGYPQGPLKLGDQIGAQRILLILERLQSATGDPRYRPSQYLRRRALLNMPLVA